MEVYQPAFGETGADHYIQVIIATICFGLHGSCCILFQFFITRVEYSLK